MRTFLPGLFVKMGAPVDRLQQLEVIEREISSALTSAAQGLSELAREKPIMKPSENHTTTFLKTLESVENNLTKHIQYLTQVSTSQPYEGSSYAAQKDLQMAFHRIEHVRSRLSELEKKNEHYGRLRQQSMQRSISQPGEASMQRSMSQQDVMPRGFSLAEHAGLSVQRSFSQPDTQH